MTIITPSKLFNLGLAGLGPKSERDPALLAALFRVLRHLVSLSHLTDLLLWCSQTGRRHSTAHSDLQR